MSAGVAAVTSTAAGQTGVDDAVAPPPRHPRFALIDGTRALAVICVVLIHSAEWSRGGLSSSLGGRLLAHLNIGVTIFFLISGFLLYRPMIAHRAGGAPAPATGDYARRRFLRIYPAYWVVLTVLVIVPGLTGVVDGHWWPMYTLVHTLPVYHGTQCAALPTTCGLAQTWSLVVEVTFYVALPVYAVCARVLTRGLGVRGWMAAELLLLLVLSAVSVVLQFAVFDPVPAWFANSVAAYVPWFALGMGMAVVSAGAHGPPPRAVSWLGSHPGVLWATAAAAYVLVCLSVPASPFLFARGQRLEIFLSFGLIAALVLAPAVFGETAGGLPRRLLAHPVVAWIGLISYGIFLWHYEAALKLGIDGAKASFVVVLAGTLSISIACAAVSYYVVERPVLRLKYHRWRDLVRRPRPSR